jgi:hypothetical protein
MVADWVRSTDTSLHRLIFGLLDAGFHQEGFQLRENQGRQTKFEIRVAFKRQTDLCAYHAVAADRDLPDVENGDFDCLLSTGHRFPPISSLLPTFGFRRLRMALARECSNGIEELGTRAGSHLDAELWQGTSPIYNDIGLARFLCPSATGRRSPSLISCAPVG